MPVCPVCDGPCEHEMERGPHVFPDRLPAAPSERATADPTPTKPKKSNRRGRRGRTGPDETGAVKGPERHAAHLGPEEHR